MTQVRAAATASGSSFFTLNGAQIYSPYVGEAELTIRALFKRARSSSPAIIFFDEVRKLSCAPELSSQKIYSHTTELISSTNTLVSRNKYPGTTTLVPRN